MVVTRKTVIDPYKFKVVCRLLFGNVIVSLINKLVITLHQKF